jgi:hypothetical protein
VAPAALAVDRRSIIALVLAFVCVTVGVCFRLNSMLAAAAFMQIRGRAISWRALAIARGARLAR